MAFSSLYVGISVVVSAEILLRSPQRLFMFGIKKYGFRVEVSKKEIILFEKIFAVRYRPMFCEQVTALHDDLSVE